MTKLQGTLNLPIGSKLVRISIAISLDKHDIGVGSLQWVRLNGHYNRVIGGFTSSPVLDFTNVLGLMGLNPCYIK